MNPDCFPLPLSTTAESDWYPVFLRLRPNLKTLLTQESRVMAVLHEEDLNLTLNEIADA